MRLSEFRQAIKDEFGDGYGRVLTHDLVLTRFGSTADQALAGGASPREVWLALCAEADVPESRWHGVGLPAPKK